MINIIVKHTNEKIVHESAGKYQRDTYTRPTTHSEIEALMGIILLAGVQKSNRLNAEELFATDGSSPECFRLCMSLQRSRFLPKHVRFDDQTTREERKAIDKMAPIREFFDQFVTLQ